MKKLIFILFVLFVPWSAYAQTDHPFTCTNASTDAAGIQAAINAAVDGDTVTITGPTCLIASIVNNGTSEATGKHITIQPSGPVTLTTNAGVNQFVNLWSQEERADELRFTGFTVNCIAGETSSPAWFAVRGSGVNNVRFDHVTFNECRHRVIQIFGQARPLFDHLTHTVAAPGNGSFFYGEHGPWPCTTDATICGATPPVASINGHGRMASPVDLGSDDAVYIEDSIFNKTTVGGTESHVIDGESGFTYVLRFNDIRGMNVQTHGTEGGLNRGAARVEVYGNVIDSSGHQMKAATFRAITGMVFNNAEDPANFLHLGESINGGGVASWQNAYVYYRTDNGNATDVTEHYGKCTGWGYYDINGVTALTGEHTGANGVKILEDNTKTWTFTAAHDGNDQWATPTQRYGIKNTGPTGSNALGLEGFIYANDATHIYIARDHTEGGGDSAPVWNTGDDYAIRPVGPCIDQTGWIGGPLLHVQSNSFVAMLNNTKPAHGQTANAFVQDNVPTYGWNNTANGTTVDPVMPDTSIACLGCPSAKVNIHVANRDYYNQVGVGITNIDCDAGAFDGSCGVGVGAIASRPATCTTGVGYWATDQGEWNSTNGATADGRFDKCTATNTWTDGFYLPYTYPHPVASGAGTPPVPSLTSVTPAAGPRNNTHAITLDGQNLDLAGSPAINHSCGGLTVNTLSVTSSTTATANFVFSDTATLGDCSFTFSNANGVSNALTFTVTAANAPTITSLTPQRLYQGQGGAVILAGTGFDIGTPTVFEFGGGAGLTISGCVVDSATQITCNFAVAISANPNQRAIKVTTSNGTTEPGQNFRILGIGSGNSGRIRAR